MRVGLPGFACHRALRPDIQAHQPPPSPPRAGDAFALPGRRTTPSNRLTSRHTNPLCPAPPPPGAHLARLEMRLVYGRSLISRHPKPLCPQREAATLQDAVDTITKEMKASLPTGVLIGSEVAQKAEDLLRCVSPWAFILGPLSHPYPRASLSLISPPPYQLTSGTCSGASGWGNRVGRRPHFQAPQPLLSDPSP